MGLKILYIDAVYPYEWLQEKHAGENIHALSFYEYRDWVLGQRIYLSDYISGNLRKLGHDCEEVIVNDPVFISKLGAFLSGKPRQPVPRNGFARKVKDALSVSILDVYRMMKPSKERVRDRVVQRMWEYYQPDVVFVREPTGISTYFWKRFRHRSVVAGLIGCSTAHPTDWLSHNFDVLFSITDEYNRFFKSQGIASFNFSYGIDQRVYDELSVIVEKKFDIVFAGSLGDGVQANKTNLLEQIAARFDFAWWGPENVEAARFPNLSRSYKGRTSGIEMLTVYRMARIVLNDYVNTANGQAVNLRLYEALNVGSFLLTRNAGNLGQIFPEGLLETYESSTDCIDKISYYLANADEREMRASKATQWALKKSGLWKKN